MDPCANENAPQARGLCFALPPGSWRLREAPGWWELAGTHAGPERLCTRVAEGLSRVLPALVCGEESAVNVFHREGKRLDPREWQALQRALGGIEDEERVHQKMLLWLSGRLPMPSDLDALARRTRRFFMRMQSRDVALHFGRIAELDSAVCRIMHAVGCSTKLGPGSVVTTIVRKIQRDEARHVKVSRIHSRALGLTPAQAGLIRDEVRAGVVGLLDPVADAFDAAGVDSDRLFRAIQGRGNDELPHPG